MQHLACSSKSAQPVLQDPLSCQCPAPALSQLQARNPGSRANHSQGQMTPAGISSCLTLRQFTSLSKVCEDLHLVIQLIFAN